MIGRAVFNDHQLTPLSKTNYMIQYETVKEESGALSSTWKYQTQLQGNQINDQ